MMILLDTNVVSEVRKSACDSNVAAWMTSQSASELCISAITVLEIQRGISQLAQRGDSGQATIFTRWLETMVLPAFSGRILSIDHEIARQAALFPWPDSRDYRDALIAATAMMRGAAVATRNVRHFEPFGVRIINPWASATQPKA